MIISLLACDRQVGFANNLVTCTIWYDSIRYIYVRSNADKMASLI